MNNAGPLISRRTALIGGGAGTAVLAMGGAAPVSAAAPQMGAAPIRYSRFMLGDLEITTLLDGEAFSEEPQKTFGMNVDSAEFARVSEANFLPTDNFFNFFTPTLINTGKELILFDTGLGEGARPGRGRTMSALEAAGYTPDQVDVVVLTHMHPDHILGLMENGMPAYPNARYVTGSKEYNFWSAQDPESNGVAKLVASHMTPLAEKTTFLDDGGSVVSGITAMAAEGHTPGHMTYMLESSGKQLLLAADTANHFVWSLGYPDWEVRFDMDKAMAAKTRRKVLSMLASDKIPFSGYHMPFPAVGFIEANGNGFRFVAESYQLSL
ncbi:MAG: MBL fold metallo-hydrolase [Rhodobacteraceae bacterium]|nr:MBL fold metallo-hydrolase [Paracoccaceae bacterium]